MKVSRIKDELKEFMEWQVVTDLTFKGAIYMRETLAEFIKDKDEIPYECYEVLYDWDDWGAGDGKNCICFYTHKPGFLESQKSESAKYAYSKELYEKYKGI